MGGVYGLNVECVFRLSGIGFGLLVFLSSGAIPLSLVIVLAPTYFRVAVYYLFFRSVFALGRIYSSVSRS